MGATDHQRPDQSKGEGSVGSEDVLPGADGAVAPPVRITLTFWQDRGPEYDLNGLADYIGLAVLREVADALEDEIKAKQDDSTSVEEGDDE